MFISGGEVQKIKCLWTEWISKLTWVRKWVIEKQQEVFVPQTIWEFKTFYTRGDKKVGK